MIRKFLLAVMLTALTAGGGVVWTASAQAAEQTFEQQVAALVAANPAGGDALQAALASLIGSQADPAAAAAAAMVALSGGTSEQLAALGGAINGIDAITPEALEAAIASAVANASDPVAASQAVLACATYLSPDHQGAAGRGLATAAADIGVLNPTLAASIEAAVEASDVAGVKTAYAEQMQQVGSTNTQQQNATGDFQESQTPPVSPN